MNSTKLLLLICLCLLVSIVRSRCDKGCDLAYGSYYIVSGDILGTIASYVNTDIPRVLRYNPSIPDQDSVTAGTRINLPFSCDCINGEFLGHVFSYGIRSGDTYYVIANKYANLTTAAWIDRFNSFRPNTIPDIGTLNVTVNCSCGDKDISKEYGLFSTYPLRPGESLSSVSSAANLSSDLIRSYNPNANFSAGSGLVYIPARDANGNYPPIESSKGLSGAAIGGIVVGVVALALLVAGCVYYGFSKKKNAETSAALLKNAQVQLLQAGSGITVDKSVEFSYEELSTATDDFSLANKIGQGGFGAVYYAELRGEKAAIKKMDMQASREFLAELKVLTHVHHLNLVRLIGYCVEGSLFLVYEFIENGNLSQHLHGSARDPLPWSTRVQIALDSARGLEYIHEHTIPVYVHRDIKSANILINKNFHGKVADFGLTRLTEVGNTTRPVGTFGYMPPEYVQYGDVSPKVDVYAFGVVLYELISAKEAIVKANGSITEPKGLVALFEEVLSQPDPKDDLIKIIDPRMGDNYHLDSVQKMAQLAKACTHGNPQLRPSMRSIVVALMTLSSSTKDLDVGPFYENQTLEEMVRLRDLGANTPEGVAYTEEQILAMVIKGKQRGHIAGRGRVVPGLRRPPLPDSLPPPPGVAELSAELAAAHKKIAEAEKKSREDAEERKTMKAQLDLLMGFASTNPQWSQYISLVDSQHVNGSGSGADGSGSGAGGSGSGSRAARSGSDDMNVDGDSDHDE